MKKSLLFLLSALLLSACATQQQRAEERSLKAEQMSAAIAQRRLHIDISGMNTLRYGSHRVTPDFYLELRGDTLVSYLPFYGQAYHSATYSTPSQGLNFTAPVEKLIESRHKRGMTRLEMLVNSDEDHYVYRLEVYPNGQAYIQVRGQYRDPISFDGVCK